MLTKQFAGEAAAQVNHPNSVYVFGSEVVVSGAGVLALFVAWVMAIRR